MRTIEKYFELASKGGEVSIAEKTGNFHEFSDHDFGSKSSVGERYNVPDFEFPVECRVCGDNPRINGSFYCPSCHPSRDEEGVSNDELVVGKYDYDYHSDKVRRNTNFDASQTPDTVEKEEDDSVDDWEPYLGPEGGEGWKNPNTDEVVYSEDPPGDSEFEFLDEPMDPQDVREGDVYSIAGQGGELITVDVIDVSETGVTVQDQDGSERQVEIESLAERVVAEKNPDDVGISSGDTVETNYGFDITVDEIQSAGVIAEDGYFYSFDDISESELETNGDAETDEEPSSSDLEEDVVNDIVDRVGGMGGRDPYFDEDVLNELRNYSVDDLQEIQDSAKRERDGRDLILEFQRLNPQEVQDQMLEEYVDADLEDIYVPSSAIANELLEEYETPEEVFEFLESEYGNYEMPDEKSDTDASRIVNYVAYQQGGRDVEEVVDFTADDSRAEVGREKFIEEAKSSTKKAMNAISDKMDPNVEAFTMAGLEEVNVEMMDADGKFTGSRIKIDPFAARKDNVVMHEIGHQVHNAIGIDNMGIDNESYDNNIAPDEPEFGYNMDVTADRLGVDAPDDIKEAWENYADGNATMLRDYQNRNLVEYAAVSFRYAMRNEHQLERRDPKIKSFWDKVFSGGKQ